MMRRRPRCTRADTLFPDSTLFRSHACNWPMKSVGTYLSADSKPGSPPTLKDEPAWVFHQFGRHEIRSNFAGRPTNIFKLTSTLGPAENGVFFENRSAAVCRPAAPEWRSP